MVRTIRIRVICVERYLTSRDLNKFFFVRNIEKCDMAHVARVECDEGKCLLISVGFHGVYS